MEQVKLSKIIILVQHWALAVVTYPRVTDQFPKECLAGSTRMVMPSWSKMKGTVTFGQTQDMINKRSLRARVVEGGYM